jgi:hypothetical protein
LLWVGSVFGTATVWPEMPTLISFTSLSTSNVLLVVLLGFTTNSMFDICSFFRGS